jgi:hypothetical protein
MKTRLIHLAFLLPAFQAAAAPPFAQQAFFKSSNSDPGDRFGESVAISGNIAAVGAPGEDGSASGVNGAKNNDGSGRGAVYLFTRTGSTWTETAYLKAGNPPAVPLINHHFGEAVAISGNTLVVGAPGEESNAIGVNGDSTNQGFTAAGAAYVFVLNNGVWTEQAYLKASNTGNQDSFGISVAISGDTIVVGAVSEDGDAASAHGSYNENASESGAAYVYERTGNTWAFTAYLKAPNAEAGDDFGRKVAISGDTIVVGAAQEDGSATTVNGVSNNDADLAGAAYVFQRNAGVWTHHSYLKPFNLDADDRFGTSVAIQGDTILVGAVNEAGNSTGVNGADNDLGFVAGAVYEFTRSSGVWSQGDYIKPLHVGAWMSFGTALAIDGNRLIVSAKGEISAATGVDGDATDTNAFNSGAAYLFEKSGDDWAQIHYLKASNTALQNEFGQCVAISDQTALVGTGLDDASSQGVNASQTQDANVNYNAGAAYVFHSPTPASLSLRQPSRFPPTGVGAASRPKTILLTNPGEETLTGLSVQVSGPHRRDFPIRRLRVEILPGGRSTPIIATFRPGRAGLRTAFLEASGGRSRERVVLAGTGRRTGR